MQPDEAGAIVALIRENYDKNVARYNSDDGNKIFYDYLNIDDLIARNQHDHFTLIAKDNDTIAGVIEVRNNNHISLFFVHDDMRRQGIGKKLFEVAKNRIIQIGETKKITANSSPNSTAVYRKLGFTAMSKEKVHNGLRYVPMSIDLTTKP